jgi:hypothetical protein
MKKRTLSFPALVFFSLVSSSLTHALQIQFKTTDITDTASSEDLWRYSYKVSDFTFNTNIGFSIFYDPSLYRNLGASPAFVNTDWNIIVLRPILPYPIAVSTMPCLW